jgi:hypothetical protein
MAGPVQQALLQFGYRYARECCSELLEGQLGRRIKIRVAEASFEYLDYSLHW